jgi:putative redox protein
MTEVIVRTARGAFEQQVVVGGRHQLVADEPLDSGGDDHGPAPHDFILVGLGSCTSMTMAMYARRKGWPLEHVEVRLRGEKKPEAYVIECDISMKGALDAEQRSRLLEIANKCPVHRTLVGAIHIEIRER